ncbi:MAG: hypothetical protein PWR31_1205 [Bacillota bacterium]|jgi:hypothetical protein|nr:hypothetical protein [Bacillota bacterium]MDK2927515.1 hypothetical protein [Bacillota bacterium]
MDLEIFRLAASQGLWAVLFVALLFWTLKENSKRESRHQDILNGLAAKLAVLENIEDRLDHIGTALLSAEIFWQRQDMCTRLGAPHPLMYTAPPGECPEPNPRPPQV